jgi:hypothetical protein
MEEKSVLDHQRALDLVREEKCKGELEKCTKLSTRQQEQLRILQDKVLEMSSQTELAKFEQSARLERLQARITELENAGGASARQLEELETEYIEVQRELLRECSISLDTLKAQQRVLMVRLSNSSLSSARKIIYNERLEALNRNISNNERIEQFLNTDQSSQEFVNDIGEELVPVAPSQRQPHLPSLESLDFERPANPTSPRSIQLLTQRFKDNPNDPIFDYPSPRK